MDGLRPSKTEEDKESMRGFKRERFLDTPFQKYWSRVDLLACWWNVSDLRLKVVGKWGIEDAVFVAE
jgi:hypothetical protein